jgi:hypothetical protein
MIIRQTYLSFALAGVLVAGVVSASLAADPFAEPMRPPKDVYDGPLFELSVDYPDLTEETDGLFPWQEAIGGGYITVENASAYAAALKLAVSKDMEILMYDFENWNAASAGWFNQPWLGTIRDGIHGTYQGSSFPAEMFPVSALAAPMTTHVLVYYDKLASQSLRNVWGEEAMDPVPGLEAGSVQMVEGSMVVKPALTTADASIWPPMEGAQSWPIYASPDGNEPVSLFNAQFFQFDVVVKDSVSAPKTQWVYMTLVYDKDAEGTTNWDKMVPLGVMWGNDPDVNSPIDCNYLPPNQDCPALSETWINADAPIYAKETLGWGGRLSGPNDGAVDINASVLQPDGSYKTYDGRYAMSSCMGCHGSASFEMGSFLLPSPSVCEDDKCSPTVNQDVGGLVYYPAGSAEFMEWFQDRPGYEPQVAGTIALDYGMNYAFKALPQWFMQTGQLGMLDHIEVFNDYRGVSPDHFE